MVKYLSHMLHVSFFLPTKLGDFVRADVGVHIPAPWFANGYDMLMEIDYH